MTLACDICRCASSVCPVKESCQRWVDKGCGCYRIPWSSFYTPENDSKGCDYIIPIDKDQTTS